LDQYVYKKGLFIYLLVSDVLGGVGGLGLVQVLVLLLDGGADESKLALSSASHFCVFGWIKENVWNGKKKYFFSNEMFTARMLKA
jgi:hypothetical protein